MARYRNNTVNNIHTDQKLHMIECSCWMCLLAKQLTAIFSSKSAKIATLYSMGVVGQGTAIPHLFHVLL